MFKIFDLLITLLQNKIEENAEKQVRKKAEKLLAYIKSVEKISGKITAWTLTIMGGTFLAILSDEYIHPEKKCFKLAYLTFIIGWLAFAKSIYHGINISGSAIASELYTNEISQLKIIFKNTDSNFSRQLTFFRIGLVVFGIWLLLYLTWWVFGEIPVKAK